MFWTSIISDFEFDLKLKELQELENKYPEYFDESPYATCRRYDYKNFKTVPQ
jgi:DNA ligase (NAD+)